MATEFTLTGDSNCGAVGRAARAASIPFKGGPVANGRRADERFFEIDDAGTAMFHEDLGGHGRFTCEDLLDPSRPMLSTLGFNTQRIGMALNPYLRTQGIAFENLSDAVLDQGLEDYKAGPLAFYREAVRRGIEVFVTYSPQRFPETYFETAIKIEALLAAKLQGIGVTMVDVRAETTDDKGRLLPELATEREGDQTHANDVWGKAVLDRFLEMRAA